jgi:stearoyl-CoA desaturase (delta-9 desaturase)
MSVLLFFTAVWYLSLFSQTFFHHRYASHGAFKMSRGWERFFFVFTYLTQGAHYMSPRAYAIMHRLHHAHTDTTLDPHSPAFSSNIFTMMLRTRRFYTDIFTGKMKVDIQYTKNLPEWPLFDRWANSTLSRLLWAIVYTGIFIALSTSPWQFVLLPVILGMGAFHGAVINWFAHKFGYFNFVLKNTSRNLFFIDVLMLGESYHNNHHKRPSAVNFGYKWHEIDPVYPIIRLLGWLRIIRLPKVARVPRRRMAAGLEKVLLVTAICFAATTYGQQKWELKRNEEGIKVYTSASANPALHSVKVVCKINTGMQQFTALLMDAKAHEDWVYNTRTSYAVKQLAAGHMLYYSEIEMPWPLANREVVVDLTIAPQPDGKMILITASAVPLYVASTPGKVRVKYSDVVWKVIPAAAGQLLVEYTATADPGGNVALWVTNAFLTRGPFETFKKLKILLDKAPAPLQPNSTVHN